MKGWRYLEATVLAVGLALITSCSPIENQSALKMETPETANQEVAEPVKAESEPVVAAYIGDDAMFDLVVSLRDGFLNEVPSLGDLGVVPQSTGPENLTNREVTPPRCEIVIVDGIETETINFTYGWQNNGDGYGHGYGVFGGGQMTIPRKENLLKNIELCEEFSNAGPSLWDLGTTSGQDIDKNTSRLKKFEMLDKDLFASEHEVTMDLQVRDPADSCLKTGCRTLFRTVQRNYYMFEGENFLYFEITLFQEVVESDVYPPEIYLNETDEDTDSIAKTLFTSFKNFVADKSNSDNQ